MSGGAGHLSQHVAAEPTLRTNSQNFVHRVGVCFGFSEAGRRGQTHTHFRHRHHIGNGETHRKSQLLVFRLGFMQERRR